MSSDITQSLRTKASPDVIVLDAALMGRLQTAMAEAATKPVPPICAAIKHARRTVAGISQEEAARRLKLSLTGYRTYESFREPTLPRLRQIAAAFGLEPDYFLNSDIAEAARSEDLGEQLDAVTRKVEALMLGLRIAEDGSRPEAFEPAILLAELSRNVEETSKALATVGKRLAQLEKLVAGSSAEPARKRAAR